MKATFRTALALLLCTPLTQAATFVVDDDGGPGVDFTDLPAAIAAAARRDLILVRPGQYSAFELRVGLTLLGEAGVFVGAGTRVVDLPAGDLAVLALVDFDGLEAGQCAGTLLLSEVRVGRGSAAPSLLLDGCADVRVQRSRVDARGSDGSDALHVFASRLELVQSEIFGGDGMPSACGMPSPGGQALVSEGRVHAARSRFFAGRGGDSQATCASACGQDGAGYGGTAVVAFGGEVIFAGDATHVLRGGDGGLGEVCDCNASSGPALFVSAGAMGRVSGVAILSGDTPCLGSPPAVGGQGLLTEPAPDDATLELEGTPAAGSPLRFRVHGPPGATARLRFGRRPILAADGSVIEALTQPVRSFDLGPLPNSGQATRTLVLPASFPVGFSFWAQAEVDLATGLERTNSVCATLR